MRFRCELLSVQVSTLGKGSWTHGHIASCLSGIVQAAKHCVRIAVANAQQNRGGRVSPTVLAACLLERLVVDRTGASAWHRPAVSEPLPDQAWNDEPQPQVPDTFGLPNLKPEPLAPST